MLGLDTWAYPARLWGKGPQGPFQEMDVLGHSSLGHLVLMLLTALASGPRFASNIARLPGRAPNPRGLPFKPSSEQSLHFPGPGAQGLAG